MKTLLYQSSFLIAILFTNTMAAQCTLDKSGWSVVFDEEFLSTYESLTQEWKLEYTQGKVNSPGGEYFEPCTNQDNISIINGLAYFETKKLDQPIEYNGHSYYYTTGMLRSKFDEIKTCNPEGDTEEGGYLFGMFEIHCKLPRQAGKFPSFWMTGNNSWPPEIDAFEYNGNTHNSFFSSVHWPDPNFTSHEKFHCSNFFYYPYDLTEDFHTWTIVWTPHQITWFFDNKELKTDNILTHIPALGKLRNSKLRMRL